MTKITYGRQTIEDDDIAAIVEAIHSGWLTQGFHVEAFEEAIAGYCGAKYAVVCSNGTTALHLAYLACGIGEGDAIITSPNTFVATANAALYAGARPYFTDIDPITYNIAADKIPHTISNIDPQISNLKAIIPVHFAGLACDMEAISNVALKNNLIIIEDACHALGSRWRDSAGAWHRVGDCSHSRAAVFSFHPVKTITTGEGGAVTTNDNDIYKRLRLLRSHGITKEPDTFINKGQAFTTHDPNPWYYEMHELGFNYRITDIQCAMGMSQLKKLDRFINRRHEIASLYNRLLTAYSDVVKLPVEGKDNLSARHLYPVEIAFDRLEITRNEWFKRMSANGIWLQVHYIPVHSQPYYQKRLGLKAGDFPVSEAYYKRAVSLPIYPLLADDEVEYVVECMIKGLELDA